MLTPDLPLNKLQEQIVRIADDDKLSRSEADRFAAGRDDICAVGLEHLHQAIHVSHIELKDRRAGILNAGLQRLAIHVRELDERDRRIRRSGNRPAALLERTARNSCRIVHHLVVVEGRTGGELETRAPSDRSRRSSPYPQSQARSLPQQHYPAAERGAGAPPRGAPA